jgi:L-lactate permease
MNTKKFLKDLRDGYLIAMIISGIVAVPIFISIAFLGFEVGAIVGGCIGAINVLMTIKVSINKHGVMKSEK